jgi:hypothetical protein
VRIWDVEHDRRDFAEFYALARDDCLRVPGSAQTFGGTAGGQLSRSVTGVQRRPPSPGNVARTLVTIPAGFRQYLGREGDQQPHAEQPSERGMHLYRCGPVSGHKLFVGVRSGRPEPGVVRLVGGGRTLTLSGSAEVPLMSAPPGPAAAR